jgi:hypothetical protein
MKLLISNYQAIYMSSMNIIQIPIFVMQSYDLYMMLKCRWLLLVATHFGHTFQILLIFIFNATLSYKLCLYIDGYHFLQANFKFLLYVKDLVSYIVNFIICETRSFKGGNFNFFWWILVFRDICKKRFLTFFSLSTWLLVGIYDYGWLTSFCLRRSSEFSNQQAASKSIFDLEMDPCIWFKYGGRLPLEVQHSINPLLLSMLPPVPPHMNFRR